MECMSCGGTVEDRATHTVCACLYLDPALCEIHNCDACIDKIYISRKL